MHLLTSRTVFYGSGGQEMHVVLVCLCIPRHILCSCSYEMAHAHTIMHTSIQVCFLRFFYNDPYMSLFVCPYTTLLQMHNNIYFTIISCYGQTYVELAQVHRLEILTCSKLLATSNSKNASTPTIPVPTTTILNVLIIC